MRETQPAKIIWDYLRMGQKLEKADCIIVLGCNDTRVAERGAEIFLQSYAPLIIFTGYLGALTLGNWDRAEAEVFADIAVKMGVPGESILIENKATNTGENITFSRRMLADKGIYPKKVIAVQKPYMERRTFVTFETKWPGLEVAVTSPELSFEDYPNAEIPQDQLIHSMVGVMQRMIEYPKKGYQGYAEIPPDVMKAYKELVKLGFTKQLIKSF
jgi:uncharacterized SAM-binding protein YcdF (DUF218 family)